MVSYLGTGMYVQAELLLLHSLIHMSLSKINRITLHFKNI